MKSVRCRYAPIGLLLATLLACESSNIEDIPQDLEATIGAFYVAIEAGDHEARIDMFSDSAIMMPNHWTMSRGKETIATMLRAGPDAVFLIRNRRRVDAHASDGLAYTVHSYEYTYHARGDSSQWHKTKNVHIWKRDDTGRWKLHVDIWNSDVPIRRFADE